MVHLVTYRSDDRSIGAGMAGDHNKLKVVVANKETATKEESLLQVINDFMNLLVNLIHKKYYYRLA